MYPKRAYILRMIYFIAIFKLLKLKNIEKAFLYLSPCLRQAPEVTSQAASLLKTTDLHTLMYTPDDWPLRVTAK